MRPLLVAALSPVVAVSLVAAPVAAQTLAVYPPAVRLDTARGRQGVVVRLTEPNGVTRDVTDRAALAVGNPAVATLDRTTIAPVADGATELTATFAGLAAKAGVTVTRAKDDRPVSFKRDVMPVFLRAGCNSGGCHGAARGKDGFRLSLFGFDPDGDHFRLTREVAGRRVDVAVPAESLLLTKATGAVPHSGGKRVDAGDESHAALLRWLEGGAPNDPPGVPLPVAVEVFPPGGVFDGKGETQRLAVRAQYADGTVRDVTAFALFHSTNDAAAKVSAGGTVTAGDRGEAFVMARFHTFTVGVPFVTLPKGLAFTWPAVPEHNYVDALVNAKLKTLRVEPSPTCSDEAFVRRVYLDVVGTLPTPDEHARFLVSTLPDKRALLVDELLGRKEFAELWGLEWAELLQIRAGDDVSKKAALQYHGWLQDKIARNVPTDVWVRELIGASGGTFAVPPTNYYQTERDPLKVAENVAQVFLGMRVQCAQCHNHPFDRWTMDDYYGFAAFFARVGRKPGGDPRETVVFDAGGGEAKHPVGGRAVRPKFLGGPEPDVGGRDRRAVLADWLVSADNPYFARNLANRVWAHFLGRGIVDEVDDARVSNPPSNPELLDELAKRFAAYRYDMKKLVRDICLSQTYQRSTRPTASNAGDGRNFARGAVRRLRAETLLDVVSQVTESRDKFPGLPAGSRAVQIADGAVSTYFLTTFGRPTRTTACACEVRLEPTLGQSLHLLNGDTVAGKIGRGNVVGKLLAEGRTPAWVIENLYVRCLSRPPTADEMRALLDAVVSNANKQQALEDVFWALLNSREFVFNH